jgi:site-specific recombinase XerD
MRISKTLTSDQRGIQAWLASCLGEAGQRSVVGEMSRDMTLSSASPFDSDGVLQLDFFDEPSVRTRPDADACKSRIVSDLDGSRGRYRREQKDCLLLAANDYEAIRSWVRTKGAHQDLESDSHTQRAYLREAERLLLWSIIERDKPLSSLTHEDCVDYVDFLRHPEPENRWCGARGVRRWSSGWRPFEGPLSPSARRQAIVILNNLFTFLQAKAYLAGNAMAGIRSPRGTEPKIDVGRSLTKRQWSMVETALIARATSMESQRLTFALRFLYATGVRLSEAVDAKLEDLQLVELDGNEVAKSAPCAWMLTVRGKGGRIRQVPMPGELMAELRDYLCARGLSPNPRATSNRRMPLIARLPSASRQALPRQPKAMTEMESLPLSQSALYKILKAFFQGVAAQVRISGDEADAERFDRASTHWLRHTHASHAIAHGMSIEVAQQNLGHASLSVTTVYVRTERDARIRSVESFWGQVVDRR